MKRLWIVPAFCVFGFISSALADTQQNQAIDYLKTWVAQVKGQVRGPVMSADMPPLKCGTPAFAALATYAWLYPNPELALVVGRPENLPGAFGTEHFLIHYATAGPDSVYQPQIDSLPGIPRYVTRVADVFEHVWFFEIDSLGYQAPPPDFGNGGDYRYDIYLVNLGFGFFGFTAPESTIQRSNGVFAATSFIEIESNFAESPGYNTHPLDAVKVTAAHEFFHSIQFSYDEFEEETPDPGNPGTYKPWWEEASSTWMEDIVYPDIKDFLQYLPFFYKNMWMSLTTFSQSGQRAFHPYASCVWPIYMTERFNDVDIIRDIWQQCGAVAGYNTLPATNDALVARGSDIESAFLEFEIWNFHTGSFADPLRFYRDGALFPTAETTALVTNLNNFSSFQLLGLPHPPEDMATNYIIVRPNPVAGGIGVNFSGRNETLVGWHVALLGHRTGGSFWFDMGVNPSNGIGQGAWHNWDLYDAIVLIPTVSGIGASDTTANFYSGELSFSSMLALDNDVAAAGVISPSGPTRKDEAITPEISYANIGRTPASFTAHLVIGRSSIIYDHSVPVNALPPAQSIDVTFPDFLPTDVGIYSFVASSDYPGDQFSVNDTTRINLIVVGGVGQLLSAYPSPFVIEVDGDLLTVPYSFNASFPTQGSLLRIYDVSGSQVREVKGDFFRSGSGDHVFGFRWDGKNDNRDFVASGIYIYHIVTETGTAAGKIAVINDTK